MLMCVVFCLCHIFQICLALYYMVVLLLYCVFIHGAFLFRSMLCCLQGRMRFLALYALCVFVVVCALSMCFVRIVAWMFRIVVS